MILARIVCNKFIQNGKKIFRMDPAISVTSKFISIYYIYTL